MKRENYIAALLGLSIATILIATTLIMTFYFKPTYIPTGMRSPNPTAQPPIIYEQPKKG